MFSKEYLDAIQYLEQTGIELTEEELLIFKNHEKPKEVAEVLAKIKLFDRLTPEIRDRIIKAPRPSQIVPSILYGKAEMGNQSGHVEFDINKYINDLANEHSVSLSTIHYGFSLCMQRILKMLDSEIKNSPSNESEKRMTFFFNNLVDEISKDRVILADVYSSRRHDSPENQKEYDQLFGLTKISG